MLIISDMKSFTINAPRFRSLWHPRSPLKRLRKQHMPMHQIPYIHRIKQILPIPNLKPRLATLRHSDDFSKVLIIALSKRPTWLDRTRQHPRLTVHGEDHPSLQRRRGLENRHASAAGNGDT